MADYRPSFRGAHARGGGFRGNFRGAPYRGRGAPLGRGRGGGGDNWGHQLAGDFLPSYTPQGGPFDESFRGGSRGGRGGGSRWIDDTRQASDDREEFHRRPPFEAKSNSIIVHGSDYLSMSDDAIQAHFSKFGRVEKVFRKDKYAFVHFENDETAQRAVEISNDKNVSLSTGRVCREFKLGRCNRGDSCWYSHAVGHSRAAPPVPDLSQGSYSSSFGQPPEPQHDLLPTSHRRRQGHPDEPFPPRYPADPHRRDIPYEESPSRYRRRSRSRSPVRSSSSSFHEPHRGGDYYPPPPPPDSHHGSYAPPVPLHSAPPALPMPPAPSTALDCGVIVIEPHSVDRNFVDALSDDLTARHVRVKKYSAENQQDIAGIVALLQKTQAVCACIVATSASSPTPNINVMGLTHQPVLSYSNLNFREALDCIVDLVYPRSRSDTHPIPTPPQNVPSVDPRRGGDEYTWRGAPVVPPEPSSAYGTEYRDTYASSFQPSAERTIRAERDMPVGGGDPRRGPSSHPGSGPPPSAGGAHSDPYGSYPLPTRGLTNYDFKGEPLPADDGPYGQPSGYSGSFGRPPSNGPGAHNPTVRTDPRLAGRQQGNGGGMEEYPPNVYGGKGSSQPYETRPVEQPRPYSGGLQAGREASINSNMPTPPPSSTSTSQPSNLQDTISKLLLTLQKR